MTVKSTLHEACGALGKNPPVEDAELWLERVEVLLDWIVQHPKLVEIRSEAGRLLADLRGENPIALAPNRRV